MQPNQSFFQKNKKSIIILSIILLIFILILYFLFFNNKSDTSLAGGKLPQDSGFSFSKIFGLNNKNNNPNTKNSNNNPNTNNSSDNSQQNYYKEGLIKVWSEPVAGYSYYYQKYNYTYQDANNKTQTKEDTKTILIFVDSKTGFIYEKNLLDPTSNPTQITNSSYPNVFRAFFLNDDSGNKDRVVLQYLENGIIKTKIARIPTYSGLPDSLINITDLSDNISYISTSPDNKNLVYIVSKTKITNKKQDVYSDWYLIKNSDIVSGSKIYTSELTDWKLNITNDGNIYAFNTDTAHEISNIYKLNTDNNNLEKIFNGITGTSFIINQNNILISMNTSSGIKDYFGTNNNNTISLNNFTNLNFITLSNKCALSETISNFVICGVPKEIKNYDTGLPDAWYQGFTSWDDNIYLSNNDYSLGTKLFDINNDASVFDSIDMRNLKINNNNTHLGFINKNDGSLWTLNIDNILNQSNGD